MLATNCRHEFIKLSLKEKSEDIPASAKSQRCDFEALGGYPLTLKEECRLIGDQITSEVLRRVDQAGNECSAKVNSLDEIKQGRLATFVSFNLNCTLHHGKCVLGGRLSSVSTAEALDRLQRLLLAPSTH
jgi:hypothetical protein